MNSFNQTIIRHKVGLLNLASELGNISKACKVMGVSRDTFYRYQHAHEEGGVEALIQTSRRKPNPKNRVDEAIEATVIAYALEQPAHGQLRTSNECVSEAYSCLRLACVPSGCVINWPASSSVCRTWKPK